MLSRFGQCHFPHRFLCFFHDEAENFKCGIRRRRDPASVTNKNPMPDRPSQVTFTAGMSEGIQLLLKIFFFKKNKRHRRTPKHCANPSGSKPIVQIFSLTSKVTVQHTMTKTKAWSRNPFPPILLPLAHLIFQTVFALLLPLGLQTSTSLFISTNSKHKFSPSEWCGVQE